MSAKEGIEFIKELTREYAGVKIIAISGVGRIGPFDHLDLAENFGASRMFKKRFMLPRSDFGKVKDTLTSRKNAIMMTTVAALMATLPIALGLGAGSESRRPLGLCVVGGLLFSQLVTLYVTPVFYIYLDKLQGGLGGFFGRRKSGRRRR